MNDQPEVVCVCVCVCVSVFTRTYNHVIPVQKICFAFVTHDIRLVTEQLTHSTSQGDRRHSLCGSLVSHSPFFPSSIWRTVYIITRRVNTKQIISLSWLFSFTYCFSFHRDRLFSRNDNRISIPIMCVGNKVEFPPFTIFMGSLA